MATNEEQTAAARSNEIANWNKTSQNLGLQWMNDLYDAADEQNRNLLKTEGRQNRQKTEADRFNAQRNLQNAARGLTNTVGAGLNSSAAGNISNMLLGQQDADNLDYWSMLRQNQNTIDNAYQESQNQNYIARREAAINAELAKRDIEGNQSASLQNISPDLYESPWVFAENSTKDQTGYTIGAYNTYGKGLERAEQSKPANSVNQVKQSGYVTDASGQPRTAVTNNAPLNDYFSRLLRGK